MSIEIASTKVPVRTRGDGHWKKFTYQDTTFTLTLSGLLKFDDANWTGWDMLDTQFNFSHVLIRCTFIDDQGNIRTIQGYVMIETSTISYSPGHLVKEDFQLQGNGKLDMFDGYIPCDAVITGYDTAELTGGGPNVRITYTYTGAAYQIKYRLNNMGDYTYALATHTIYFTLAIGEYDLEVIPVCQNGYEGTGFFAPFLVTQGLTCGTVISNITIDALVTSATAVYTGAATQMKYRVDGGAWFNAAITAPIPLTGLSIGSHTIEMVPICANMAQGTGFTKTFTKATQPGQSQIKYTPSFDSPGIGTFSIYVNGVLTVSESTTQPENSIFVSTGASVRSVLTIGGGHPYELKVVDETTAATLYDDAGTISLAWTSQYTFTADSGNTYNITGTITSE